MGITHKTMESQRLLLRCFMLCTFVLWVGSCGDPHTGEVVSMDDTEQTKAVDKLTDLLHHEHKKSSISFSYSHSKATNLGEDSHKHAGAHKSGPADGLIQMGELLDGFKSLRSTSTGEAVSSLTSALRAKELMDTLKPSGPGSFGAAKKAKQAPSLGENGDKDSSHPTFHDLMHAKEKNMAAITQYLMARKGEGRPLTADEDQQLQKFYYNRASTTLSTTTNLLVHHANRNRMSIHLMIIPALRQQVVRSTSSSMTLRLPMTIQRTMTSGHISW